MHRWFKSSHSGGNDSCVEVAVPPNRSVLVRDTKAVAGPILRFSATEWQAFVTAVRHGEFTIATNI
ncbi:DUF397 domain-containing protein [Pseudonocardia acaciae]|uniref:DUF397 domain-containing protein n=1 Tax=Pseudonocardia acaciae TaxID=551276 RepID=UPI00048F5110|nr:DUF397 domain-containing protein [Pseudonocardia acaciae]